MPRNLSGVYTLPAGNPVVPGTTIDAAWANSTLEDMANEITNSLSRTGAGGMLAPFRIADGNVTAPGLSFLNETNTGYFRSGAGATAFSILGVSTLQLNTTSVTVPNTRTLNAQGNALVGGTLGVTGAATFASTLAVTGALTATGGVLGNVTAASGTSTFNDLVINGSLDMVAGSSATITGLSTPTNASDAANKGYVDTQDALRLALTGGTMSGVIAMGANKITGLGTPTADTDAANKAYVDSVAQGLDVKASVRAATTANITLSGAQTIDGVSIIAGDRVLVKNQSTAADNGIYVAAAGAWSRSADANTWDELVGAFVFVEDGTTNDNSGWVCSIPPGGTLGVTAVTFEQFSGAGQINAGTGMTKSGNTLNVNTASASRIVVGADEIDLATTGVVAGTYKSVTVDQWGRITGGTNPTTLAGYGITDAYTTTATDSLLAGKLSLTGGTMSGAIAMGTNRITGMGDPVNAQDAATKNYIDTIFGSTASAAASAAAAASSASAASTSATNAATSASNAATSATSASTSLFNFRAQYLGPLSSNPSVDGNGNPVTAGDLYFNTVANETRVYTGSAWLAAYLPSASYVDVTTNQTVGGIKTFSSNPILSGGTANGVAYLNASKVLTTGSALTFDGTTLVNTGLLKVGTGAGSNGARLMVNNATNTATGIQLFQDGIESWIMGMPANSAALTWAASGSEQMRLTSTGLGIGTSSPVSRLHLNGSGNTIATIQDSSGVAAIDFVTGAGTNRIISGLGGTANLGLYTASTLRATLDSSGNLGLGVTPSAWQANTRALDLGASSGDRGAVWSGVGIDVGLTGNAAYIAGNFQYKVTAPATSYEQEDGVHRWRTAPSGTAGNAISFTQAMTLDASGNLGVGTTSPTNLLHLKAATNPVLRLEGASDSGYVDYTNTRLQLSAGGGALYFVAGNTERARITSAGDFIQTANTTAPTLTTNGTVGIQRVSDTQLKLLMRGSDGVTRSVTLTLA